MKLNKTDWQALRYPLLMMLAVSLLGVALVFYSHSAIKHARDSFKQQQRVLQEASDRLHKSGDEKDKILRYRTAFAALQQRGLIGEEQRINWVDALRVASLNLKMFGVNYQIEAQQAYPSPAGADMGAYQLHQSVMKITMGLLHEEDLARFMSAMTAQQAGFFIIKECDLKRQVSAKIESLGVQPHLSADCSLAWLTMSEKKEESQP